MGITIRKGMFSGLSWQPDGTSKRYSITPEQIFPSRTRNYLMDLFSRQEQKAVWFHTYIYDKINKTLFLSQSDVR